MWAVQANQIVIGGQVDGPVRGKSVLLRLGWIVGDTTAARSSS